VYGTWHWYEIINEVFRTRFKCRCLGSESSLCLDRLDRTTRNLIKSLQNYRDIVMLPH